MKMNAMNPILSEPNVTIPTSPLKLSCQTLPGGFAPARKGYSCDQGSYYKKHIPSITWRVLAELKLVSVAICCS